MNFVGTISVRSILTMTFSIESVLNNDINRADNFSNKTITHLTTLKANYVASRVPCIKKSFIESDNVQWK